MDSKATDTDSSLPPPPVSLGFMTATRKGTSFPIEVAGQYRFGRDPECEIHLPEPNVSRVHARCLWDGTTLTVEDMKSTNGVFVNGEKVTQATLHNNDVVSVGPCVFRVHMAAAGTPSVTVVAGADGQPAVVPADRPDDHAAQFQSLFECMLAIQRILGEDSERMVEQCLETLFLALPVTRLCMLNVNPAGEFEPWLTRTKSGTTREFVMSKTFARKVREAGKGLLIHDALSLDAKEWGHTMQQQEVRSILGVPVFSKGTLIAILLCDNLETPNVLRDVHVRTLEFFARALDTVFQREHIRTLEASQAATERQFIAAKRVQKQIFTKKPQSHMAGLDWALYYRPALHVGGDFYDFWLGDKDVSWLIADVTGKGISAALVVSMLKGLCKSLFPRNLAPREMMVELNKLILDELPPEMFLTALVMRTDESGLLTTANAGHLPLLVVHPSASGAAEEYVRVKPPGVPLGFLASKEFDGKIKEETFQLRPGDRIYVCTDGVTECANAASEFFGEKRMIEELLRSRGGSVSDAVKATMSAIDAFQGAAPQHDDITMVHGQYLGAPAKRT